MDRVRKGHVSVSGSGFSSPTYTWPAGKHMLTSVTMMRNRTFYHPSPCIPSQRKDRYLCGYALMPRAPFIFLLPGMFFSVPSHSLEWPFTSHFSLKAKLKGEAWSEFFLHWLSSATFKSPSCSYSVVGLQTLIMGPSHTCLFEDKILFISVSPEPRIAPGTEQVPIRCL